MWPASSTQTPCILYGPLPRRVVVDHIPAKRNSEPAASTTTKLLSERPCTSTGLLPLTRLGKPLTALTALPFHLCRPRSETRNAAVEDAYQTEEKLAETPLLTAVHALPFQWAMLPCGPTANASLPIEPGAWSMALT